jgi:hypothetical protein
MKFDEQIGKLAVDSFKDHVLETLVPAREDQTFGMWRCRNKKGGGIYAFTVSIMPWGIICVAGDVGDVILRCSYPKVWDVLGWIRGALNSPDYLIEKAQPVCRDAMEEFSSEMARAWLTEMREDGDDDLASRIDAVWDGESSESWQYACFGENVSDIPACTVMSASACWSVECLRLFIRLLDAEE